QKDPNETGDGAGNPGGQGGGQGTKGEKTATGSERGGQEDREATARGDARKAAAAGGQRTTSARRRGATNRGGGAGRG
ncbi:hypothetical protein C3R44_24150, partial [Mycobacterium tuberculosis]